MLRRSLLLVAILSFKLAAAQGLLLPAPLPGYGAVGWRLPVPALPGRAIVSPLVAPPIPTVGAAASYPPLSVLNRRFDQALPDNRLVYYHQNSPVATGASLVGAVAGWLLGADPRVQAYQQSRQFTGRYDALATPRQARPDDLLR